MNYFIRRVCVAVLACVVCLLSGLTAQTTRGSLAGVVTDATGAVVSGANVTVAPMTGGEPRTATTGGSGEYRIEALTPGLYRVTVTAPSFANVELTDVTVRASVVTSNNVQLKAAQQQETVTVEAVPNAVQTETGELSKTLDTVEIKDLPIISLNPYQLATTLPGVVTVASRDAAANGVNFSVNGLRERANNFLVDGFDNNDNGITGQAFQPQNQEAVQEVTVLTNSYAAEFGRGGGSVSNLTFRSGSNNFHGAAWEQYSGAGLNALSSEESANGLTAPAQFVNNVFGFRFGGPVVKDKLFFFGTSQWGRFTGAQGPPPLTIPTANGFNTLSLLATNPNVALLLRELGAARGSTADPAQVNNVDIGARAGCVAPCSVEVGPFTRTDKADSPSYEWTARVDYTPTSNDSIFARYTGAHSSLTPDLFANPFALQYADTQQGGPSRLFGLMWAHTFSPTVLNEFRFSAQQIDFAFSPTAATLANPDAHLPTIVFANAFTPDFGGFSGQGTFPQGRGHKTFQFQDSVSVVKGAHSIKFGTDLAILLVRDLVPFNSDGFVVFGPGGDCTALGLTTCTDLANFIDNFSGPGSGGGVISKNFGSGLFSIPTSQQAYYVQDSWKFRPNLSLDLGLRYEYQPPDSFNILPFPGIDRATLATDPLLTRHEVQPDRNNFGPRVGFAYSPHFLPSIFGSGSETVIRGGWGMYYDALFTNIADNVQASSPNSPGFTQVADIADRGIADPITTLQNAAAAQNPRAAISGVDDHLRNPLTHQWNLNIQRQLPSKMVAEVAYVGTRGEREWVNEQLNPRVLGGSRIIPTRGSVVIRGNRGDSIYHGLQTSVTRSARGLTLRGAYTWSRSIDNQSDVFVTSGGASRWENVFDPRSDRGPSAFNRTHRATVSYVYELPVHAGNGLLNTFVGGWSTSGVLALQSGTPETVFANGFDVNGDGETANDRPDLGNPNAAINYSSACLSSPTCITGVGFNDGSGNLVDFNTGAPGTANDFKYILFPANSGHQGNLGRNTFVYPGTINWDTSVIKRFKLPTEGDQNIEMRVDLFNVMNHPNLGVSGLQGNINSVNFLNVDATRRGGRTLVLWAKYSF